jgi:hypothetical protein
MSSARRLRRRCEVAAFPSARSPAITRKRRHAAEATWLPPAEDPSARHARGQDRGTVVGSVYKVNEDLQIRWYSNTGANW